MSKRASPTVVGIFVIIGIALTLAAIVVFGSGQLFRDTARTIAYFDGSVSGLRVGAAVKFRGIDIGTVKDIRINMSGVLQDPTNVRIPVVLEIDVRRVSAQGVHSIDLHDRAAVQALVDRGLRAELATESLVTGLRYVALDVKPGTPAKLVNDPKIAYPEIPSIPSALEQAPEKLDQILSKLSDVDFGELVQSVRDTADDAHRLLGSPHLANAVAGLDQLTITMNRTVTELEHAARDLGPLVKSAGQLTAPEGALSSRLDATLKDVGDAARSTRRLADQLTRDPGSIVRGGRP